MLPSCDVYSLHPPLNISTYSIYLTITIDNNHGYDANALDELVDDKGLESNPEFVAYLEATETMSDLGDKR